MCAQRRWLFVLASVLTGCPVRAAVPSGRGATPPSRPYAIVVEQKTVEDAGWKRVVETLRRKRSARIFHWKGGEVAPLRQSLRGFQPAYVCFVARPDELARQGMAKVRTRKGEVREAPVCGLYYHAVDRLMRSLDDDPYEDAMWAVLTGATPQDAARVVSAQPLVVRRGLSHVTSGWLEWLDSGVSFSEVDRGRKWVKQPGRPSQEVKGPDDTAEAFTDDLNSDKVDMVSSSGHATEHDWQMGYSYRNGQIITRDGVAKLPEAVRQAYRKRLETQPARRARLLSVSTSNEIHEVRTDNPKIYYSPGNCRIARVDGPDCMALGWIHHGAMQFFGHVGVQTRSCYAWGVAEYFLMLQGRFTFAEAVWLNRQALTWQVGQMSPKDRKTKYTCCRNEMLFPVRGRLYWQTTVLYGDPAWTARVKPVVDPLYDQDLRRRTLPDGRTELTFTVRMRRPRRPSRPAAFLLRTRPGAPVEVRRGPKDLVLADNFALVPFWKPDAPAPEKGQTYEAVAVAGKAAAGG